MQACSTKLRSSTMISRSAEDASRCATAACALPRRSTACSSMATSWCDGRCQTHMVDDNTDIGAVGLAVQKIASVTQMPVPSSVDICGVIVSAEHPQEFQTKEGKALVKREITVADDSGHSVLVTLWGDRAR